MTAGAPPPLTSHEAARRRRLSVMRRRATGMLVVVTLALLAVVLFGGEATWVAYVRATLEASMVGALADWFAVTALFRHPAGVPIPHTAIIPERKDQFGETLGEFVQSSFLTPDVIVERARTARVADRLAIWLSTPAHAERLAGHLATAVVTAADVLRDDEVQRAIEEAIRHRIDAAPLAPLAGRALGVLTEGGRAQQLLDVTLRAVGRFLEENTSSLRAVFAAEAPWWMPEAIEDRLFDRMIDGARKLVNEVAANPHHELRREADARIRQLVDDLQTSDEMLARGEELKAELLDHPAVRAWVGRLWQDLKAELRGQAADPGSQLRRRLADAVGALGQRLRDDRVLAARVEDAIETGARYVSEQFDQDLAALVSHTIARWDAHETADRLELLLGPDLQFIRINGTIVGGLAGLAIYSIAQVLG